MTRRSPESKVFRAQHLLREYRVGRVGFFRTLYRILRLKFRRA